MYEASFCSNESSEYELNSDTLDQLYKEQLQMLRELVFKQSHTQDIELCRKWLKIFSKTSKAEKMARNCLCSLMQQQLQEEGTLSEPFTNLQNCNRDLERVLQELDNESCYTISANYLRQTQSRRTYCTSHGGQSYRQNYPQQKYNQKWRQIKHQPLQCPQLREQGQRRRNSGSCDVYDVEEYANVDNGSEYDEVGGRGDANGNILIAMHDNCTCGHELIITNADNGNDDDDNEDVGTPYDEQIMRDNRAGGDDGRLDELSTECEENEKLTENLLLRRELEGLRLQLTEKEIENLRLKEIAEKYQMQNSNYDNVLEGVRKKLLIAIKKALQHWSVGVVQEEEQQKQQKPQQPKQQPPITTNTPMNLFEMIFKDFEDHLEFSNAIKAYDNQFEQIIAQRFEAELNKRKTKIARHISRKLVKGKKRVHEKYEQRLRIQNWAQRLQLKLVKLKCFSALRQSFINAQLKNDGTTDVNEKMWDMLRVLEEKYHTIVNEII